jgi:hypothetical protein
MTIKEKIKLCFQILFKGRDINMELDAVEQERIHLAERMKEQLELLINSAKRNVMADANSTSNCYELPIYEVKIAPLGPNPYSPTHGDMMDVHLLQLERIHKDFRITGCVNSVTHVVEHFYEEAAHHLAKTLISKKLLRVDTFRCMEDFNSVILRFTAEFYNQR